MVQKVAKLYIYAVAKIVLHHWGEIIRLKVFQRINKGTKVGKPKF